MNGNIKLYEILVPTRFQDNLHPVSLRHHKEWDKFIKSMVGGLTILKPAKGQWNYKGTTYEDRVIPVRIACTEKQIEQIGKFTRRHYRQVCVMYYEISSNVVFEYN